jgi:hypothetical protein
MRKMSLLMVVPVLALLMAFPLRARAGTATFTCNQGIQQVTWDGRLFVDCIGQPNRFIAYPGATSPCPTLAHLSLDDAKVLETMAAAAFLSGKTLIVKYETSSACLGAIYFLSLSR